MKKLLSIILMLFMLSSIQMNATAFGGYAHCLMAEMKGLEYGKSGNELLAYKSGCLLADIGKLNWDNDYGAETDGYTFTSTIYNISRDYSLNIRQFANGWRDHYIQDQKGSVANTTPPMSSYRIRCAWIDEYIRDKLTYENPIQNNELDEILINHNLIRETCDAVYGFRPSDIQIEREITNMFASYDAAILANTYSWTNAQKTAIDNEITRTMSLCIGPKKGVVPDYRTSNSKSTIDSLSCINIKQIACENKIEKASQYLRLEEKESISEDDKIYSIINQNPVAYQQVLRDCANLIVS